MPELPEVETIRRQIEPRLQARSVTGAGSHPSAKFTPARDLVGARLTTAGRRGKFLIIGLDDQRELVVHLGMTGTLRFEAEPDLDHRHLRAWWQLDGGESHQRHGEFLLFHDIRRFGRIRVVTAGDYRSIPTLATAGPEPFDPSLDDLRFWQLLSASRRRLKTQLLSQKPVAGVGNIYADEAFWFARIHPAATRISRQRAGVLLEAIRHVLTVGLDNGGTTLRDYRNLEGGAGTNQHALAAYGRAGSPCRRCTAVLRSAVIDARTTTWCPCCQRY